jgi:uncharacterized protein (TIGR02646 family)
MKPVEKGTAPRKFASYTDAKPHLIDRLGSHCSYCEVYENPTSLSVEHIYPKDPHPRHEKNWENFLISCTSCNSKKHVHLGSKRQRGLLKRYLWPHLDNTARAFQYFADGRIEPASNLAGEIQRLANATMDMAGLMGCPAKAKTYEALAIAYSGASIRKEVWDEAADIRNDYLADPQPPRARMFAQMAVRRGYFSIWMEVFRDRAEMRHELIAAFKADPQCFDQNAEPKAKGRV